MSFIPTGDGSKVRINNQTLELEAGVYNFTATFDYAQLTQLSAKEVLNSGSQALIAQEPDQTTSLSFLSYTEKLLAGAWRFLTYFGRDSMISALLLQPVLSAGEGSAVEAVISAVLERINKTDGSICHEETIGDYATYQNQLNNISSTAPICSYVMIDSDYYLMPLMETYFIKSAVGRDRRNAFLTQKSSLDFGNQGLSYANLARINAQKIMSTSAPFARQGGQVQSNLIHIKDGQIVGEWRDSTYGIGGGKIPYDVNTALVPAALRSIASLSAAGFFPDHPEWKTDALAYAQVWEDNTLHFFEATVPASEAKTLVTNYTASAGYGFPSLADNITSDVTYHGLALDGNNDQPLVKVMNTDDCFRHFLLNTTNQTQLTSFVNQTANNILQPFPVGLSTPVGLLVANPAYGGDAIYAANWTNNAYHGTVVWSWPMSMMAAGLQRQLGRCLDGDKPDFCSDTLVYSNAVAAYNHLWDLIEANTPNLSTEVWSWLYRDGGFQFEEFGALPPPPGSSPTESDIRQLWSLTFLAVTRDETLV
jgi:glycogen debranching enzyme